jgi:biopolymer transport protein ExbD/biopolymer transport protein TolR
MALAKRRAVFNSDINVTPMVDVMLVLLIIFMVVTPMLQKGLNVDLAKTNNPIAMEDADKEDAVLIAITRDGQIFFDTEKITLEGLTTKVSDKLSSRADKKIFIKSDARAQYGTVVKVVDGVRSAGVDQVGLLTEQKKPSVKVGGD